MTCAPSEPETPVRQCSPSPARQNQSNNNSQTDKVDKDRDCPFLKDLHFKVLDSIQVMLDLIQYQIQNNFPNSRFQLLQDHFPDQEFVILINPSNVTIATAWVILQTIVSDIRIEMPHVDNLIRLKEVITETSRDPPIIQTTDQILDIEILTTPQRRVNFTEPPMYSDLQTGNQR